MAGSEPWIQRSLDEAVQLFHLVSSVAVVVALRAPLASLQLDDDRRALSVGGIIGEFGDLESAAGVVPVTIALIVGLFALLVATLVLAVTDADQPESGGRRVASVVVWITPAVIAVAALLLALVLSAADHAEADAFDPPFATNWAGLGTLLLTAAIATIVSWRVRHVTG